MTKALSEDSIKYIIGRVVRNANDVVSERRKKPDDAFLQGKGLAYYEILDSIRNDLLISDTDLSDFGLENDPFYLTMSLKH